MTDSKLKRFKWMLHLMGWFKIPLIGYLRPQLIALDEEQIELKIKLRRRSKNHLKSMYFGALAVGADVAAGLHVFYFCDELGVTPAFAFKGMKAEFIKRAESDTTFVCTEGQRIKEQVLKAIETGERQNHWVHVLAKDSSGDVVAKFDMEISVKLKQK